MTKEEEEQLESELIRILSTMDLQDVTPESQIVYTMIDRLLQDIRSK